MSLFVKPPVTSAMPSLPSQRVKFAITLAWFTLLYNVLEGLIAMYFGIEDHSVALAGFGADSFIEAGSAIVILWRLWDIGHQADKNLKKERLATAIIGYMLAALGAVVIATSIFQLLSKQAPTTTIPGVVIALVSVCVMFYFWKSKEKLSEELRSPALKADASCARSCMNLSFVLLAGSFVFWLMPSVWWVDSLASVIIGVLISKEGIETVQATKSKDFDGGCGCHH